MSFDINQLHEDSRYCPCFFLGKPTIVERGKLTNWPTDEEASVEATRTLMRLVGLTSNDSWMLRGGDPSPADGLTGEELDFAVGTPYEELADFDAQLVALPDATTEEQMSCYENAVQTLRTGQLRLAHVGRSDLAAALSAEISNGWQHVNAARVGAICGFIDSELRSSGIGIS